MTEAGKLFSFLSQLADSRETITRDIEKEKFLRYLDINDNTIAGIKLFQGVDEKKRKIILSLKKSTFLPCPPLTDNLEGWFDESYKDFHTDDVKPKNRRVFKIGNNEVTKFFLDSDKRTREFAEWKKKRILWRQDERKKEAHHTLFNDLYRIYEKLKTDETYELYVGNGLFYSGLTSGINYPLLLRRAFLRYNNDFMELIDAGEETIFSEEIFKETGIVAKDRLTHIKNEIRRLNAHPLDSNLKAGLLADLSKLIHTNCRYSEDGLHILPTDWFIVYEKPVLFIRKKRNKAKVFINKLADFYSKEQEAPLPLAEFFNPSKKDKIKAKDIILPKIISPNQRKILDALLSSALVTVDAPPGVGKTHSILNFLVYFLLKGKRALVTGSKKVALKRFVQSLPQHLKELTVSYKKNDCAELEKAVMTIAEKIESADIHTLREKIEAFNKERKTKGRKNAEFKTKLKAISRNEQKTDAFKLKGKNYSLSDMARYLAENENLLNIIPGNVRAEKDFPLSTDELKTLYELNKSFTPQTLREIKESLPKSEQLLTPFEFDELLNNRKRMIKKERGLLTELPEWSVEGEKILFQGEIVAENINRELLVAAEKNYLSLNFDWMNTPWAKEAVLAGRMGGEIKERYLELLKATDEVKSAKNKATLLLLGKKVEIKDALTHDARIMDDLEKIGKIFKKRKDIPAYYRILNRRIKNVLKGITINNYPMVSAIDVKFAQMALSLEQTRARLESVWQELMTDQGEPPYKELADNTNDIDETVAIRAQEINHALEWYDKKRGEFIKHLKDAGIDTDKIIPATDPFATPRQQLTTEINWLISTWPTVDALFRLIAIEKEEYKNALEKHKADLINHSSILAKRMLFALVSGNSEAYKKEYELLLKYESLAESYEKRQDLLSRLKDVLPDYAAVMDAPEKDRQITENPEEILQAYQIRQFAAELEKCENLSFTSEYSENHKLNPELLESAIFEKFLERISKNGVKGSLLRLSKAIANNSTDNGQGKLSDDERKLFAENMPLWVMPVEDVFAMNLSLENKFDVIFIDDATSLDSFALSLLAISDKAIIFGDRCAPVKLDIPLLEEIIPQNDENNEFYKTLTDTSLYELIRLVTEPYHLRDEFRSPKTLSNIMSQMTYNNELKPMRLEGNETFMPKVLHGVYGSIDPIRPVNFAEAEETVLLMAACLMEKEYQDKTFSVITMSEEQAETVFEIAMRRIHPKVLEKIAFISAPPKDYEGIERDIVFLSLIDDNTSVSNTPSPYELSFAISRAKEQLFVVYSKNNFVTSDPRRYLFEDDIDESENNSRAKTALGRELAENLRSYGFDVRESFPFGSFTLEIAIFGENKAVIVPIGEEETENIDEAFLTQINWKIFYVRGSNYYRNKQETILSLIKTLVENNINAKEETNDLSQNLIERVYKNVENLREEFKEKK